MLHTTPNWSPFPDLRQDPLNLTLSFLQFGALDLVLGTSLFYFAQADNLILKAKAKYLLLKKYFIKLSSDTKFISSKLSFFLPAI